MGLPLGSPDTLLTSSFKVGRTLVPSHVVDETPQATYTMLVMGPRAAPGRAAGFFQSLGGHDSDEDDKYNKKHTDKRTADMYTVESEGDDAEEDGEDM